ncbi:ABC transporter ATP-binding protein [Acetonema longum]|uniref:ABC transporter related protein n=1 Tax=Acetonema longum DSM 6540 TaxID=1009370 RepID=F7NNI4_9FIRM|nr:ABC transporter ATP-binding protein [Acetonema longum]EGO62425.1 ABC transporter related protein [Acetonema longum DSM 6540]
MNKQSRELLWEFMTRYWRQYLVGMAMLIVVDVLQTFVPRFVGRAVDRIAGQQGHIWTEIGWILGIAVAVAILRYFYRIFIMGTTRHLEYYLRRQIFAHALRLPLSYYEQAGPGGVMALMTNDVTAIRVAFGLGAILLIDAVVMGFAAFFLMARTIDLELTCWSLLPLPFIMLGVMGMGEKVHIAFRQVQEKFSRLTEFSQQTFAGLRVVKGFAAEHTMLERFEKISRQSVEASMKLAGIQAVYLPVTHSLPFLTYAIALYLGGRKMMDGQMTAGDLTALIGYLGVIIWPLMGLGYLWNVLEKGAASLQRIVQVLAEPVQEPQIETKDKPDPLPGHHLEFRDLTFYYPGSGQPALQSVSFQVPPGAMVGIVGRTGAGKSTLLKLVLRLYHPPAAAIFIGGQDIHELNVESLRHHIGYVPQETLLFSRTIAENIAFDRFYPEDSVKEAARLAAVTEDIHAKTQGMETVLGEKGKKLSGGQQQRVAIARALVKEPSILLLDDVFSALDYRTQQVLLSNMRKFLEGKTSVIVSQRVAAVKQADMIYVMDRGRIVEQGNHRELVTGRGLYYQLYEQQLAGEVKETFCVSEQ